jgi:uncharacterized protein YbbC (DUF1343 family)
MPLRPLLPALTLFALLATVGCTTMPHATARREPHGAPAGVLCGIDVLERDGFKQLEGRHIALITNQTGLDREGRSTVELFAHAPNLKVVCLFSPEHGLWGNVDEKVGNSVEPKTGLKVFSLYGKTYRPTDEMLQGVDTLVYDIQDVGARFYTYSATLGNCMEAAAQHHLKFVLLDRPNPITGTFVDGPIADKTGFTAYGPMPVAHGMTFGELARLYNDAWNVHCDLTVIQVEGWRRQMWYDETGLTWVNPSPNMRNLNQAILYPAICLLERTNVSVGRGTDEPFSTFGAPWIDARKLSAALNAANLPGVRFIPIHFTPKESKFKNERCSGVYVLLTNRDAYQPIRTGVTILWTIRHLFGDQFQLDKADQLLDSKKTLQAIKDAKDPRQIEQTWASDLRDFKALRRKYLIYP